MTANTAFRLVITAIFWSLAGGGWLLSRYHVAAGRDLAASMDLVVCAFGLLLSAIWTGWLLVELACTVWRRIRPTREASRSS